MEIEIVKQILEEKDLKDAFMMVFKDTANLVNEHYLESEDIDGYLYIYDLVIRNNALQYEDKEMAYIEMMTVNVYRFSKFYWRGRSHADYLFDLLNKASSMKRDQKADFYFELGTFYRSISRYQKSLECFQNAFSLRKDEPSLYYIVVNERFLHPDKTIDIKNESLISPRIKLALQGKGGLKIDPIEKTEEFINAFDEVHEEALKILKKEGDLELCHQMCLLRLEYLKSRLKRFLLYGRISDPVSALVGLIRLCDHTQDLVLRS